MLLPVPDNCREEATKISCGGVDWEQRGVGAHNGFSLLLPDRAWDWLSLGEGVGSSNNHDGDKEHMTVRKC